MRLRSFAGPLVATTLLGIALPTASAATATAAPGSPHAVLTVGPTALPNARPLTYTLDDSKSTGPLPFAKQMVTFGDGTPAVNCPLVCNHTYPAAGTYTASLTVTDTSGNTDTATQVVKAQYLSGYFHQISGRLLDTRTTGEGVGPDGEVTIDISTAEPGVIDPDPATTAAMVNVTVVSPSADSYLTVYPSGQARPKTSNSNFVAGQTAAHTATVPVGADGKIKIYNHTGRVDVVVDMLGWYSPNGIERYNNVQPTRVLDTRYGIGGFTGKIGPFDSDCFTLPDAVGLPLGTSSVLLNLVATDADQAGFLSATYLPGSRSNSSINFVPGETVANEVVVPIGGGNQVCLDNGSGHVDAVADLIGYYGYRAANYFTPVTPSRLLDTRTTKTPLGPEETRPLQVTDRNGIPSYASNVVLNVTATDPDKDGYLTVWPQGSRPGTSSVNFAAGQTAPDLVTTGIGNGSALVYNHTGHTDVVADVFGYFG